MPRRLSQKTRHVRPRRFRKREKKYTATGFQRAPVKEGQEMNVIIDDIGSRGDGITRIRKEISRRGEGIARIKGLVTFVPNTKPGDQVRIKITRISRRFAEAEVVGEAEAVEEAEEATMEEDEAE